MPKVNGKEFAYTPEGKAAAAEYAKKTGSTFQMKGSPMKRNFGIGTSPAKQIGGDAGEAVEHWKKYQATQRAAKVPKVSKTPTSIMPKNTFAQDVKFGARQGYNLDKNLRMGEGFSKATRVASRGGQIAKEIVKGTSKAVTAVTVPLILHDFYKSGQKHSGGKVRKDQKSFMAEAKKKQTSIMEKGKKTKSIFKK